MSMIATLLLTLVTAESPQQAVGSAGTSPEPALPTWLRTADFQTSDADTVVEQTSFSSASDGTLLDGGRLFPDRSRPTPRIETVPDGMWMTETGLFYAGTSFDTWMSGLHPEINLTQFNLMVRRGLSDRVEGRFFATGGAGELVVDPIFEVEESHYTVGGGLKMRLTDGGGWKPDVSVLGEVGYGRNNVFLEPDEIIWTAQSIFRWALREDTFVGLSVGAGNQTVFDEITGGVIASVFAERFWTDRVSTFTDLKLTSGEAIWAFGFVGRVTDRLFFDLSGGLYSIGVDGAEEAFGADSDSSSGGFVSTGLSLMW